MTNTIKALKALDEAGKLATQGELIADDLFMENHHLVRLGTTNGNYDYHEHSATLCEFYIDDENEPEINGAPKIDLLKAESNAKFFALAANSRDAIRSAIDMLEGGVDVEELKVDATTGFDRSVIEWRENYNKILDHLAKDYILIKRDKQNEN